MTIFKLYVDKTWECFIHEYGNIEIEAESLEDAKLIWESMKEDNTEYSSNEGKWEIDTIDYIQVIDETVAFCE